MALKVRSTAGDQESNVTTVQVDSCASIVGGDRIVIRIGINDDRAQATVSAPTGFTEHGQVSNATANYRVIEYSKVATSADVANAGTTNYYDFAGFADAADDYLFCCISVYDDAGGSVVYGSASLAATNQSGGTSSDAPSQTITQDKSLVLCSWTAVGGSTPFNIAIGEAFSEANLTNEALYQDLWANKGQSGATWAVGTGEASTSASPTGTLTLTHDSVSGSNVFGVSSIYEAVAPSVVIDTVGINDWGVVFDNELRVEIDGSGFGATQGSGSVTLNDAQPSITTPSVSNTCTVRSWSDTKITIDVDGTGIAAGTAWFKVTTDGAATAEKSVTFKVDPGVTAVGLRNQIAGQQFQKDIAFSLDTADYFFASDVQDVLVFSASSLPTGLVCSQGGVISGVVTSGASSASPYNVTVTCTDQDGNSTTDTVSWSTFTFTFTGRSKRPRYRAVSFRPINIYRRVSMSAQSSFVTTI